MQWGHREIICDMGGHLDHFELGLDGWVVKSSPRNKGKMKESLSRAKSMGRWILHTV